MHAMIKKMFLTAATALAATVALAQLPQLPFQPHLPELPHPRRVLPPEALTLDFRKMVDERGIRQMTDVGDIEVAVDQVFAANPDKLAEYRAGRDKLYSFFIGQVMRATQGKANPALVNELLTKRLAG